MTPITRSAQKAEYRIKLKQIMASIPDNLRKSKSQAIFNRLVSLPEIIEANSIFIYISHGNEVDTHELLKYFLEQGKILAVPKIIPARPMIAVPFTGWDDLVPGQLGILTPSGNKPFNGSIDVVITPGLGFTPGGYRIGYGRGYYDKWFATHEVRHKIAVTFQSLVVNELPVDQHDIPVDMVITEQQVIRMFK